MGNHPGKKRKNEEKTGPSFKKLKHTTSELEEVCTRFPHLGVKIFDILDNKSLGTCKKVSPKLSDFIGNQKFYWIHMI